MKKDRKRRKPAPAASSLRAARDALRDAKDYLDQVIDRIADPIFVKDRRHRWILLNDACCRLIGRTREELIGKSDYDYFPREQADVFWAKDEVVFATGRENVNEEEITDAQGETHTIVTKKTLYTTRDGNKILVGVIRDVTADKRAEEQMLFKNALLSAQQEASIDGILIVDEEGRIISFNQRFVDMWGIPAEIIESRSDERAIQSVLNKLADPQGFLARVQHLYGRRREKSREEISLLDGRVFDRYSSPIYGKDGRYYGRVWYFRDITGRKQAEEALREKDKQLLAAQKIEAVGRLAGGIAHEFNNLLTGVLGLASLVRQDLPPEHSSRADVDKIIQVAGQAGDLVTRLLTFSRQRESRKAALDLNALINANRKMIEATLGEGVELKIVLKPGLPPIDADSSQIEQILMNLCLNARDAMGGRGVVAIETAAALLDQPLTTPQGALAPGRYAALSIRDSGQGIAEEYQSRVFEPFFTTKNIGEGAGLGLSIVYGIVKDHGGLLDFQSMPGRGTTFKIYLPFARSRPNASAGAPEEAGLPRGVESLLVAEDDRHVRDIAVRVLAGCGYKLIVAQDGQQAVDLFDRRQGRLALALLDVVMPKLQGAEVYERIRAKEPLIKVVFMSGHASGPAEDLIRRERVPFLIKPFTPEQLARKVRETLDS